MFLTKRRLYIHSAMSLLAPFVSLRNLAIAEMPSGEDLSALMKWRIKIILQNVGTPFPGLSFDPNVWWHRVQTSCSQGGYATLGHYVNKIKVDDVTGEVQLG